MQWAVSTHDSPLSAAPPPSAILRPVSGTNVTARPSGSIPMHSVASGQVIERKPPPAWSSVCSAGTPRWPGVNVSSPNCEPSLSSAVHCVVSGQATPST